MVEYGTDDKNVRHKLGGFFIALLLDFVVLKRLEIIKYFNMEMNLLIRIGQIY